MDPSSTGTETPSRGVRIIRMTIAEISRNNYSEAESYGRNKSAVMDHIREYYSEALDRLPPSLAPRAREAGVCFGFLDPVSNILANAAAFNDEEIKPGRSGNKRKRPSSRAATSIGKEETVPADASAIAARSRRGLVTFLTTYFRYLAAEEAMRYLRLARADLLVAAHLVERDRGTAAAGGAFAIHHNNPTARTALACAAISAKHPQVAGLVSGALSLASRMDEVAALLAAAPGRRLEDSTLRRLAELSMEGVDLTADAESPMRRAVARFQPSTDTEKPPRLLELETAWDKVLLDRIHGFYLEAISRIPAPLLRSRHHRGLVKAGHCYGPFDPVTNIILNTIWYDTAFPAKKKFEVDMIVDGCLARAESNSLYGLMAFVATLFPELPSFDVTRYLFFDNARLDRVISSVMRDGYHTSVPLSDAYKAAARTAGHPNPAGLAKLATEIMPVVEGELKPLLEAKRTLSPNDVGTISKSLSQHYPPSKPVEVVQKLTRGAAKRVSARRKEFEAHHQLIRERVEAALQKHALEKQEEYELLVICGVNAEIPKDGNFGYFDNMDGYPYSHINIWARLKGPQLADAAPTLLFIQCSNDTEDTNNIPFMCLPVPEP
ncbi:unnamed protein product [Urochloa humidicola]